MFITAAGLTAMTIYALFMTYIALLVGPSKIRALREEAETAARAQLPPEPPATDFPWEIYTLGELYRMPLVQAVQVARGMPAGVFSRLADMFRATAYMDTQAKEGAEAQKD